MRYAQLLVAAAAVSLVACRDKWDVKNYAENLAEAQCAKAYDCCTEAEIEASEQQSYGVNEGDCVDETTDVLNFKEGQIQEGVDEGRLEYKGTVLERCLANYAALSCADLKSKSTALAAECGTFLIPKVDEGGTCKIDEECLSGYCFRANDDDDEGSCQPFAAEGTSCGGAQCGPGYYCGGTCVPTKADGLACRNNYECATGGCNGYDADTGTEGTCGPMGGAGTQCFITKGCAAAPPHIFAALAVILLFWRGRVARSRERVVSTQ